jgi:hypothetical protein
MNAAFTHGLFLRMVHSLLGPPGNWVNAKNKLALPLPGPHPRPTISAQRHSAAAPRAYATGALRSGL